MSKDHLKDGATKPQARGLDHESRSHRATDGKPRRHTSTKALKAHGIRQAEATRQIRELQSRY